MQTNELYHHGVIGQKWGVRRYQNKDGSLTKAGRKRYGTEENFNRVQKVKRNANARFKMEKANARTQSEINKINKKSNDEIEQYKKKKGISTKSKSISEMSDDELRTKINRLRLENEFKSLSPKKVSAGQALVKSLKEKAVPTLVDSVSDPVGKYIKKELSKQLGVSNMETASQKLKREAEDAINRQKKTAAEDWMEKRDKEKAAEKASSKSSKSDNNQNTTYGEWQNVNQSSGKKTKNTSSDSRSTIIDAEYTVVRDDPITKSGESYVQQVLALPEPKKKR